MAPGDTMLVPGSWAAPSYSLTVVAAGKSSRFHPLSIDEGTLEFVRNTSLVVDHVPAERLADGAFWYFLYRAQTHAGDGTVGPVKMHAEGVAAAAREMQGKAKDAAARLYDRLRYGEKGS